MNPTVCANCVHAVLLSANADAHVPALCRWMPEWAHVVDARVHNCAQFRMAMRPPYQVPDQEPVQWTDQDHEGAEVTE